MRSVVASRRLLSRVHRTRPLSAASGAVPPPSTAAAPTPTAPRPAAVATPPSRAPVPPPPPSTPKSPKSSSGLGTGTVVAAVVLAGGVAGALWFSQQRQSARDAAPREAYDARRSTEPPVPLTSVGSTQKSTTVSDAASEEGGDSTTTDGTHHGSHETSSSSSSSSDVSSDHESPANPLRELGGDASLRSSSVTGADHGHHEAVNAAVAEIDAVIAATHLLDAEAEEGTVATGATEADRTADSSSPSHLAAVHAHGSADASADAATATEGAQAAGSVSGNPTVDATVAVADAKGASREWLANRMTEALLSSDAAGAASVEGIDVLGSSELRERVLRLSLELAQRGKWEALALKDLVERNDALWEEKMSEWARDQAARLTAEADAHAAAVQASAEAAIAAATRRAEEAAAAAVAAESARLTAEADARAAAAARDARQEVLGSIAAETSARIGELARVTAVAEAAEALLRESWDAQHESGDALRLFATAAALDGALSRAAPASHAIGALAVEAAARGDDAVLAAAIAHLPQEVHSARGVATVAALQHRFPAVAEAGRRAALTPSGGGVLGQAVAAAAAMLTIRGNSAAAARLDAAESSAAEAEAAPLLPLPDAAPAVATAVGAVRDLIAKAFPGTDTGVAAERPAAADEPVQPAEPNPVAQALKSAQLKARELRATARDLRVTAEGVSADITRINAVFDDAAAAVAAGDLASAVEMLESRVSQGYAREAVSDWLIAAKARLAADRAVAVVRARAAVLAIAAA